MTALHDLEPIGIRHPISALRLPRRTLFRLASGLVLAACGAADNPRNTPQAPTKPTEPSPLITIGALEELVSPQTKLIEYPKGPSNWFDQILTRDPLVQACALDFQVVQKTHRDQGTRMLLGDSLATATQIVEQRVSELPQTAFAQSVNVNREILHRVGLVYGITHNSMMGPETAEVFGIGIDKDGSKSVEDYFWNKNRGLATVAIPALYGVDLNVFPYNKAPGIDVIQFLIGSDRGIHFALHFGCADSLSYNLEYALGRSMAAPGIELWINRDPNFTHEQKVLEFSSAIGVLHEAAASVLPKNWPVRPELKVTGTHNYHYPKDNPGKQALEQVAQITLNSHAPREGFWEKYGLVGADLQANRDGTEALLEARRLARKPGRLVDNLQPLFEKLNDTRLTKLGADKVQILS